MLLSYLVLDSISLSFRSWKIFPSCPVLTISILQYCFLFPTIFNMDTKLATLIGVGSSICGRISAIAATHAKRKRSSPRKISVIFSSILAALIFPTLGSWLRNEGFALSLRICGQRCFLCNSHSWRLGWCCIIPILQNLQPLSN